VPSKTRHGHGWQPYRHRNQVAGHRQATGRSGRGGTILQDCPRSSGIRVSFCPFVFFFSFPFRLLTSRAARLSRSSFFHMAPFRCSNAASLQRPRTIALSALSLLSPTAATHVSGKRRLFVVFGTIRWGLVTAVVRDDRFGLRRKNSLALARTGCRCSYTCFPWHTKGVG
jgi:hypothetical protein